MNLNGKFAERGAEAIGAFADAIDGIDRSLASQAEAIRALLIIAQIGQEMPEISDEQVMEPIRMAQGEIANVLRSLLLLRHSIDVLGPIVLACGQDFGMDPIELEMIAVEVTSQIDAAISENGQIEDGLDGHPDL